MTPTEVTAHWPFSGKATQVAAPMPQGVNTELRFEAPPSLD